MGETSPTLATTAAQPNEDDRDIAIELLEAIVADPLSAGELVVQCIAEVREAAYAAGVESCEGAADDAHASGYLEALAPLQHIAAQIDGRVHLGPTSLGRVRAIVDDALGRSS
jgi:hypothetical protein